MSEFYRNYLAVAVFIGAALLMVGAMLGVGRLLRPKRPEPAKLIPYEAGSDPVLGFGQTRITGFSVGHPIHYYDLGPVKVAPGNAVTPLYTVSNGVSGQHNVTGDTVAVGQTLYPPLWSIWEVTWKAGARKRLLTSFAAIQKARAAGDVTVAKTSLVVNCPVVP